MMLRRSTLWLLVLALAACLALPAVASASAYSQVLQAFSQSSTGTLSPCAFSSATLAAAEKQAPNYDFQYSGELTAAIQAALSARANGACSARKHPAAGAASTATLKGADTQLPGSATSATSGGLPLVLALAFGLGGACLLVLAGWIGLGALGYDPRPWRAARHSLREAEYRLGAGWDDLADRMRRQ
jgi:hypothetical protein